MRKAANIAARAVTSAMRYNCVRTQGYDKLSVKSYRAQELPIIEYKMNQHAIFKTVAWAYGAKFLGTWYADMITEL